MLLFTEHERKRYRQTAFVVLCGIIVWKFLKWDIFYAMGFVFAILCGVDAVTNVLGHFIARAIFKEVHPKSIRELKHSPKQYQYILQVDKREIYTHVYNKPLSDVNVRCWKYLSSHFIEVTSKR